MPTTPSSKAPAAKDVAPATDVPVVQDTPAPAEAPAAPVEAAPEVPGMVGESLEVTEWFGKLRHLADPAGRAVNSMTGREEFTALCGKAGVLDQGTYSNAARANGRRNLRIAALPDCGKCFEVHGATGTAAPARTPEAILEAPAK